jgi:RpiR family carbohydrate utilization transcriptional regulator
MTVNDSDFASARNVLEVVRARLGDLRRSERRVAEAVLADPRRVLGATVAETAEFAGVSQPTVIRFCTGIGCEGYQDFKIKLAQSLALGTSATHSAIAEADSPEEVASKVFDYTMTSLDWARHRLDMGAMNAAVDLILEADHIEFFGFGASAIVAQDLQQKFPLFGIPCNATMDSHQQLMAASMMRPGAVAVAISNTGGTRTIVELARLAREQGAKVVAMTGSMDSALVNYADVVINIETLDNTDVFTPTTSRIAALVVADVLSTLVARRLGPGHNQRLVRMKRYLSQFRRTEAF